MGFKEPSSIQAKSLPIIIGSDINLIAQSQSGTGKTACFGLGMLQMVDESLKKTQAVCVCPTLELAQQIYGVVKGLGQHTKITVLLAIKGGKYERDLTDQIVIGTAGTVADLLKRRSIKAESIKLFALDEADQMLEDGSTQMRDTTVSIKKQLPDKCRVLLFSATFSEGESDKEGAEKEKKIMEFAEKIVPKPVKTILIPKEQLTLKHMKQFVVYCDGEASKIQLIKDIYDTLKIGQSIIFVNTKNYADKLGGVLKDHKFTVSVTHGSLLPEERKQVMAEFLEGHAKVLITTNVFSRGLDISTVTHVINYDLPFVHQENHNAAKEPDYATYLHRIGRTARFGKKGCAINLVHPRDKKYLESFRDYFKTEIKEVAPEDIDENIK